jgi:uncharacterized membrane-anchored protein
MVHQPARRPFVRKIIAACIVAAACPLAFSQGVADLGWLAPGATGSLANRAVFTASSAYTFLGPVDTDRFLKLNGNLSREGTSVTIATRRGEWFGILDFSPEGYIKDDETLDAEALLKSLKQSNSLANDTKRQQGLPALELEGWAMPPRYDNVNKRLEWGTLLRAPDGLPVVNVSTRILGRSGFTTAVLVTSPETMAADLADFKTALKDFNYVSGERYSEWRAGDKVAAYGLGALVLGGAAAAATSKGGLKALWWAAVAGVVALWTGVKKLLTRRNK